MREIDQYAYLSKLRLMDPVQKILMTLMTLGLCLLGESILLYILVIVVMGYLTIEKGKTPWTLFLRCMVIPFTFLILSLLTIVLEVGIDSDIFLWRIPLFSFYIGVTGEGVLRGVLLFFKVMASISCLYFLSLSTPITDFLKGLERLKCPEFLVELMSLIYRFIFVLMDAVAIMRHAQESRLGYRNFKIGVRSFGVLLSSLLLQALKMNEQLYTALEARGYRGKLQVLNHKAYWSVSYYKIMALEAMFLLIIILDGRII